MRLDYHNVSVRTHVRASYIKHNATMSAYNNLWNDCYNELCCARFNLSRIRYTTPSVKYEKFVEYGTLWNFELRS